MKRLYDKGGDATQGNRIYDINHDTPTLTCKNGGGVLINPKQKMIKIKSATKNGYEEAGGGIVLTYLYPIQKPGVAM